MSVSSPKPEGLQEELKPAGKHAAVLSPACCTCPEPSSQEPFPCAVQPVSARRWSQNERFRRRSCHLLDTHPARLAPPGSVPVGAELSSERTTSARRRLPGRSRRPFSPAAPHRGPRPSRTPSPPPGRLPRKPRTRSSAPRPAVGWGRAGDRPRRARPRPAMPQP